MLRASFDVVNVVSASRYTHDLSQPKYSTTSCVRSLSLNSRRVSLCPSVLTANKVSNSLAPAAVASFSPQAWLIPFKNISPSSTPSRHSILSAAPQYPSQSHHRPRCPSIVVALTPHPHPSEREKTPTLYCTAPYPPTGGISCGILGNLSVSVLPIPPRQLLPSCSSGFIHSSSYLSVFAFFVNRRCPPSKSCVTARGRFLGAERGLVLSG